MNRVRRAAQTWMRRALAGGRPTARVVAVAVVALAFAGNAVAGGTAVFFGSSSYTANANQPLSVDIFTDLFGSPGGGTGTVTFDTAACSAPPIISGPTTPAASGVTNYQFLFSGIESCLIGVSWDPDDAGTQPAVTDAASFVVNDYSIVVNQDPGPLINPFSPTPTFSVTVLNGGAPVPGLFVSWEVAPPIGQPVIYGSECSPTVYSTDSGGQSSYSFADSPQQPRDQFGTFMITVTPNDGSDCSPLAASKEARGGAKGPFGSFPSLVFMLQNEDLELVFDNPPTQVVSGQQAAFPVQLRGVTSLTGIAGQTVSWSASPSSVVTPSSGSLVTDGSGMGSILLTGGTPDLMGGFLNASVGIPLPSPNNLRSANASFVVAALNLAVDTIAPTTPTFSEEQAAGFSVRATSNTGNTDDPSPGVPITFSISSGNGSFVGGGSTAVVNTDSLGIAFSPSVLIGRTNGPVIVQADGGAFGSVNQSYSVQPSTYTLTAVGTPPTQDIQLGDAAPLAVRLERGGSSTPLPLGSESIAWQISPNDGSFVSPAPTTTDTSGLASASFIPVNSGTYVVTAGFATGFTSNPSQSFTVNVTAPVLTLTAVSGDGQVGEPGTTLPNPLVVQALDDGLPPSSGLIEWTASGGVTLTGLDSPPATTLTEPLDQSGRSQVQVTLPNQPGSFTVTATRLLSSFKSKGVPVLGPSVTFTVSGGGDSIFELRPVEGNGQQGATGQRGTPLGAQLLIDGQPAAAGFPVEWSVEQGDAQLDAASTPTDSNGTARVGLQFGSTPGEVVIRATSVRGSETLFRATSAPGASLAIVSGNGQTAPPGADLAEPLVVEALAAGGGPLVGAQVSWSVLSGGGTLSNEQSTTDGTGRASTRLTLGTSSGEQLVLASLSSGQQVVFSANAAGQARRLSIVRGNMQRGLVFSNANLPLEVQLLGPDGAPVANAAVSWEVNGGALLEFAATTTDGNGNTSNQLTFGESAGTVTVVARSPGSAQPVSFTLVATLPTLGTVSGDGQSGTINQPLPDELSFDLALPPAKGLEGVPVQWQVLTGGGSLAAMTTLSNAQGKVSNRWTLGGQIGEQRVQALLPGGQQIVFTATALGLADAVGALRIVSGNPQSLPTNLPSAPLVVEVLDTQGAPLPGVLIEWTGDAQRVSLSVASSRTGSDGRASTVATVLIPGATSVSASVVDSDVASVSFQLNGGIAQIPGLTEREREVGTAIDNACPALAALPNRSQEQDDLFRRCSELVGGAGTNPDEVRDALGQLPSDVGTTMSGQGTESVGTQFDNLDLRLHMIRGEKVGGQRSQFNIGMWTPDGTLPLSFLPSAFMAAGAAEDEEAGLDFDRWGFFATGQIGRGEVDAGSSSPKFDYDIAGLTFGVDYRFSDQLVAGVALGYSDNDAELGGGRGEVATKGWNLSGYATWYSQSSWYVDGTLMVGSLDYDLQRRVRYAITNQDGSRTQIDQLASASTDGDVFGTSVSLGRDWQKGPWSLSGYLRGQFSRVESDAFVERMLADRPGLGLALAVDSRTTESLTSVVGGRATYILSRDWGILMPNVTLEWEHEFEDDPSRLSARLAFDPTRSVIEQFGDATDSDYFNVGVGVSALFPGGRSAYLYYEELVGASRVSQGLLSLGVRFEF